MTAQGPELRALADTLREAGEKATEGPWGWDGDVIHGRTPLKDVVSADINEDEDYPCAVLYVRDGDANLIVLLRNTLPTIISALERAAAAEGEKAEACPTCTPQTGIWVRHERTCATEREADWR